MVVENVNVNGRHAVLETAFLPLAGIKVDCLS